MMTILEENFFRSGIHFFTKKDDIDWEQRRYEIAKDIAAARFSKDYGDFKNDSVAAFAVKYADQLIEELKKKK